MSLLSDIFNIDHIRIMEVNKKCMIMLILLFLVISLLCLVEKKRYYTNVISNIGENVVIVVEKNMVEQVKKSKKIIIDEIESDYSINKIEVLKDVCFIYINIDSRTINDKTYKIYLGKERVLEYIIRVLRN